ncbi:putative leader peptide [Nakamurella sp.]
MPNRLSRAERRPVATESAAAWIRRRHVDLQRVSSALCCSA